MSRAFNLLIDAAKLDPTLRVVNVSSAELTGNIVGFSNVGNSRLFKLRSMNVLVVASAGNSGGGVDNMTTCGVVAAACDSPLNGSGFPANNPNVLSVGGTFTPGAPGSVPTAPAFVQSYWVCTTRDDNVGIAAPAELPTIVPNIVPGTPTVGGLDTSAGCFLGTSGSAPVVSGAAAVVLSAFPSLTRNQLVSVLKKGAIPLDSTTSDPTCRGGFPFLSSSNVVGSGLVSVSGAIGQIQPDGGLGPPGSQSLTFSVTDEWPNEPFAATYVATTEPDGDAGFYEVGLASDGIIAVSGTSLSHIAPVHQQIAGSPTSQGNFGTLRIGFLYALDTTAASTTINRIAIETDPLPDGGSFIRASSFDSVSIPFPASLVQTALVPSKIGDLIFVPVNVPAGGSIQVVNGSTMQLIGAIQNTASVPIASVDVQVAPTGDHGFMAIVDSAGLALADWSIDPNTGLVPIGIDSTASVAQVGIVAIDSAGSTIYVPGPAPGGVDQQVSMFSISTISVGGVPVPTLTAACGSPLRVASEFFPIDLDVAVRDPVTNDVFVIDRGGGHLLTFNSGRETSDVVNFAVGDVPAFAVAPNGGRGFYPSQQARTVCRNPPCGSINRFTIVNGL